MSRFIPLDKLNKLREASRNGDTNAKRILVMQMNDEDFSADLENYFKVPEPEPEPKKEPENLSKLEIFLRDNGVSKDDPEYDSYLEDFYKEFPDEPREGKAYIPSETDEKEIDWLDGLIEDEIEAIEAYGNAIAKVLMLEEETDTSRKGLVDSLEEIKRDEIDHLNILRRMKANINKPKEKEIVE